MWIDCAEETLVSGLFSSPASHNWLKKASARSTKATLTCPFPAHQFLCYLGQKTPNSPSSFKFAAEEASDEFRFALHATRGLTKVTTRDLGLSPSPLAIAAPKTSAISVFFASEVNPSLPVPKLSSPLSPQMDEAPSS